MLLKIETGRDNPKLRQKSAPIKKFDRSLQKLAKDLIETMLAKDGVGLAAPQVGIERRIAILNFQLAPKKWRPIALVNPAIIDASLKLATAEEGCLSLPEEFGKVTRPASVTVKFQDERGQPRVLEFAGINARAVQHETDHLDGILFIDRADQAISSAETLKMSPAPTTKRTSFF